MENLFSGIVGAIIGAGVAVFIHFSGKPKRRGMAYKVLRELRKKLETPKGEYCRTKTADDNYEIAQHLYRMVDGEILATAFRENPANYGENDLARLFQSKKFTRLTCEEVCDTNSQRTARANLMKVHSGASLVVIPKGERYVRIDGIFCKFKDDTYLTFLAFSNPSDPQANRGIIFREDIAESFFDYYYDLTRMYRTDN